MTTKKKYNHMFDIAFSVETTFADPGDVGNWELFVNLLRRIADLMENDEMQEACGHCDSYKNEAQFHLGDTRK